MTIISKDKKLATFINVFITEPRNQKKLVELLTHVTETSVRNAKGFISASLHRSLDGAKVIMYSQWRNMEDYQAMHEDPVPLPYLKEVLKIAKFEPGTYEVVDSFEPPEKK